MTDEDIDVFDETETETEITEVEETEVEEEVEDEKGVTEESPSPENKSVPLSAKVAETKRRQAAEKERDDALARLREYEQSKVVIPDKDLDPDGYEAHIKSEAYKILAETTSEMMREKHDDFKEMEQVFMGLLATDDKLRIELLKSKNPAKFAYEKGKAHSDFLEKSDPKYVEKLTKKLEQDALQKARALLLENGLDPASLPNLTIAAASGSNTTDAPDKSGDRIDVFDD